MTMPDNTDFRASPDDRFNFAQAIEDFKMGKLNKRFPITVVSETPPILRKLDLSDKGMRVFNRKITIPYSVIEKAIGEIASTSTGERHCISIETLKQIPDALYNPVMILDSNTENSLEIYVELTDRNNKPVMIALHLDQKMGREGKSKLEYLVHSIRSIYGKDNIRTPINRLLEGHGRYVNLKKGKSWFAAFGVQSPGASEIQLHSPYTIIVDSTEVKPDSEKNTEKNPDSEFVPGVEQSKLLEDDLLSPKMSIEPVSRKKETGGSVKMKM